MEEKFKKLIDELADSQKAALQTALEEAKAGNKEVVDQAVESLKTELGPESEHIKAIQTQLDQIETDLKKRDQKVEMEDPNTGIKKMLESDEYKEFAANPKVGRIVKNMPLGIKSAGTMLNSGNLSGTLPRPTWVPGVSKTADIPVFVSSLMRVIPCSSNAVYYVDRTARTAGAGSSAEGDALGQSDMTYTQRSVTVERIGTFITISKIMLSDNDFMQSELNEELRGLVLRELDRQIVLSSGTSNELNGILNRAASFSSTSRPWDAAVQDANYYDVLWYAIAQSRRSNFNPTHILVHSDDYHFLKGAKTADGLPLFPQYEGVLQIGGVQLVPNTLITAGQYVVCDMSKAKLCMRDEIEIAGWMEHSDNATKGLVTFTAELRAAFYFSAEHQNAFIKGTFSTDQAAILKP
nr:hypothetical protein 13 [bacterium]